MNVFDALPESDPAAAARLHERLVAAAGREGLLDVAYRTLDTPIGPLLLAGTEAGLLRVAFHIEGHDGVLGELAEQVSPRILRAPGRLDAVAGQIEEYFAGRRTVFELPLDFRLATGFRAAVLRALPEIGYGSTASYTEVAAAAGNPKAVRAAGTACARNPIPIVVPCHRVVRSDGSFGQYRGGPETKRRLLEMEAA